MLASSWAQPPSSAATCFVGDLCRRRCGDCGDAEPDFWDPRNGETDSSRLPSAPSRRSSSLACERSKGKSFADRYTLDGVPVPRRHCSAEMGETDRMCSPGTRLGGVLWSLLTVSSICRMPSAPE